MAAGAHCSGLMACTALGSGSHGSLCCVAGPAAIRILTPYGHFCPEGAQRARALLSGRPKVLSTRAACWPGSHGSRAPSQSFVSQVNTVTSWCSTFVACAGSGVRVQ